MNPDLSRLMRSLGHAFQNQSLLERALTHRSVGASNNERLEFLGDSIVNFVVGEALYQRFPHCSEGELSRLRAQLVCQDSLADVARQFSLGEFLRLGSGELKSGGFRRDSILADALEALCGAVYLDAGMETARERLLAWFGDRLLSVGIGAGEGKDAKTRLQEFLQGRRLSLPSYEVVSVAGTDHEQEFHVQVHVPTISQPVAGSGRSRRAAEQQAAARALQELGIA